jgi:small subunit ribosomal protein S21
LCNLKKKRGKIVLKVIIQEGESIDKALKRFKKKYEKSGLLKEFRRRMFYTKPSVEKKMDKERAVRKNKRILAEENV